MQSTGYGFVITSFLAYILQQRAEWQGDGPIYFKPWRYLMLITSICTLLVAAAFAILFPDNPTTARFLTDEEKVQVVRRLQTNKAGIENKQWKWKQWVSFFLTWRSIYVCV